MRNKLSLVMVSFFLLILANCRLFKDPVDPVYVSIKEPQEGDTLVQGESFMVVADIEVIEDISEINVELYSQGYHNVLYSYNYLDEGIDFKGKFELEEELTVPNDAPTDKDYYSLEVIYFDREGTSGYANAIQVSVVSP